MSRRIIGLYGGSGAGKSTAARILASQGAFVIDADRVSREVTAPGGSAYEDVRRAFPECFDEGGELNRRMLGQRVFSDPQAKKVLEELVQPKMRRRILQLIDEAASDLIVFDCALLLEPAFDGIADERWLIRAPEPQRLARIMERDSINAEPAAARLSSQSTEDRLADYADRIIENNGTEEDFTAELNHAFNQI